MTTDKPQGVHLVGSVPLDDAEDVFRSSAACSANGSGGFRTARPGPGSSGSCGSCAA